MMPTVDNPILHEDVFIVSGKLLQRKWKNLRDCYNRERQRVTRIKRGSAVPRKSQYVFHNQLSFLHRVVKGKDTSNSIEEFGEQASTSSTVKNGAAGRGKRKKVGSISPEVECLVNVLQDGMKARDEREQKNEEDDDRLFLLSLLKPMKQIPEHLRLGVRMQIMQVIHDATRQDASDNSDPIPANTTMKIKD